jgi:hypothetical protein
MTDTEQPLSPVAGHVGVGAIWLLSVIGAVLTAIFAPTGERFADLGLSLAVCTIAAFALQLMLRHRVGFVDRLIRSVVGAVVISAVASVVLSFIV